MLWFVFSAIALAGAGYAEVRAWLASPVAATLMILLLISVFYHARARCAGRDRGLRPSRRGRIAALAALTLVAFGLAVAGIVAVLKVSIGS